MNTWSVGIGLVVLVGSAPLYGQDTEWKEFNAKEGFTVLMPGVPERKEDTRQMAGGSWTNVMYMLQNGNNGFMAMHHTYPAQAIRGKSADELLDKGRDGGLAQIQGRVLSEKKLKLDNKHIGREIRIVSGDQTVYMRMRAYWANQRMYFVTVFGPKEFMDSPEADKFLSSLKLTGKGK